MYKNLRIIFTILSAICLAAAIPLGIFFDYVGIVSTLLGAGIFFMLMLLCKQSQEFADQKKITNPGKQGDDDGAEQADSKDEQTPPKASATSPAKKTYRYKRNKK